jgi:phosphatidylserine decarboxylase
MARAASGGETAIQCNTLRAPGTTRQVRARTLQPTPAMTAPDSHPDLPSRRWRVALQVLARLPQGALSRGFGRIADVPLPRPLRRPVLGGFARMVGADVSEAAEPLEAYPTLNRFFTRTLRPGVRSWPDDPRAVASPVDGMAGQVGTVAAGHLVQAKGRLYEVRRLLEDADGWRRFEGGVFVTLYLSPRDYHRIHAPVGGGVVEARHVPGTLLPVNQPAVSHVPDLFARNERLMCYVDGPLGRVAVVAVGAYNVGRISAAFDAAWNAPAGASAWVTNRRGLEIERRTYDPPIRIDRGDELMTFHLGSTVVLVFEPGRVELAPELVSGAPVRLGMEIARGV